MTSTRVEGAHAARQRADGGPAVRHPIECHQRRERTTSSVDAFGTSYEVVRATAADVPALVALLADDAVGAGREGTDQRPYLCAFREIDQDPKQFLAVVRDPDGEIVGTMQLTLIRCLARQGTKRLQIDAVRLASNVRGIGLGTALFEWAHEYGRTNNATIAQLTSDKTRIDAHRFYDRLGYMSTDEGFRRYLDH
jgi:GNAT superfamily N-acetyltransferase